MSAVHACPTFCLLATALRTPPSATRHRRDATYCSRPGATANGGASRTDQRLDADKALPDDFAGWHAIFKTLPFGKYTLTVSRTQFTSVQKAVEVLSEVPIHLGVGLAVASAGVELRVLDFDTLLDTSRAGNSYFLNDQNIRQRRASMPSRGVLELIESQPGWLLEANGVLHPRGAEYNTQYVVDGIPLTDNRSPGFAPPLDVDSIQHMNVLTAGYPAEYGRKLGGVVEVVTMRQTDTGFSGRTTANGGSFGNLSGQMSGQYVTAKNTVAASFEGATSDRYLDPPSEENFNNTGTLAGLSARYERDHTERDRFRFSYRQNQARFLVPNEPGQQLAGQRQDREGSEFMGQFTYQRVLNASSILHSRFMSRDVAARLWSNPLSTPIDAAQDRGFREYYSNVSFSAHQGRHEWKAGGELISAQVRERFAYRITDSSAFDEDIAPAFSFADRRQSREASLYLQDSFRWSALTFSAGLRADRYRFLIADTALSPRLGVAWHFSGLGLILRASYDRAFEVPAVENLLLANSSGAARLSKEAAELPVPAARGNYYQIGFSKSFNMFVRIDAHWYQRQIRNYADDEVLLNTGVSFPIAFDRATIQGVEVKGAATLVRHIRISKLCQSKWSGQPPHHRGLVPGR
ncbi:MAG: TonB-dependent receptor [Bryobacteraceae bacterium]